MTLSEHHFEPLLWICKSKDLTEKELLITGVNSREPIHIKNPFRPKKRLFKNRNFLCKVRFAYVDETVMIQLVTVGIYKPKNEKDIISSVDKFINKNLRFIVANFFHLKVAKNGMDIRIDYDVLPETGDFSSDKNFVLLMNHEPYKFIFIKKNDVTNIL
jgi:hypothetical protein